MRSGADIIKKLTPAPMPAINAWNTTREENRMYTPNIVAEINANECTKENANRRIAYGDGSMLTHALGKCEPAMAQKINKSSTKDQGCELVCVGQNTTVVRPKFKNKTWSRKDATSTIKGRSRRRAGTLRAMHSNVVYPNVATTNELFGSNKFGSSRTAPFESYPYGGQPDFIPLVFTAGMCPNGPMPIPIPMMGNKQETISHQVDNHGINLRGTQAQYYPQFPFSHPADMLQIPFHPYYPPMHQHVDPVPLHYRIHEIKGQVLYYFSPENLNTDSYLKSLIDHRSGGVLLSELIKFKRLNSMTNNGRDIAIVQDIITYECFPELEIILMDTGVGVRSKYWRNWVK